MPDFPAAKLVRMGRTGAQHTAEYHPLPSLLRELREAAELTQRALGDRLDRPHSWVYNCETGNRRVDLAEFVSWCQACGVSPSVGLRRYLARR